MKIALRLIGVAAVTVVFLVTIQGDCAAAKPESPLQKAARRLRIGMTVDEAINSIDVGAPYAGGGSLTHTVEFFIDEERREVLSLQFSRRPKSFDTRTSDSETMMAGRKKLSLSGTSQS